jgi:hypothetical protein
VPKVLAVEAQALRGWTMSETVHRSMQWLFSRRQHHAAH